MFLMNSSLCYSTVIPKSDIFFSTFSTLNPCKELLHFLWGRRCNPCGLLFQGTGLPLITVNTLLKVLQGCLLLCKTLAQDKVIPKTLRSSKSFTKSKNSGTCFSGLHYLITHQEKTIMRNGMSGLQKNCVMKS